MRYLAWLGAVSAAAIVALACSAGGAPSTLGVATTVPGSTSAATPVTSPAGSPVGSICSSTPTIDPQTTQSPFARDLELEAIFPTQLDGQPVTGLESFRWVDYLCAYNGPEDADKAAAHMPGGFPFHSLTYAHANGTVAGSPVGIDAFRTPGQDANVMIAAFDELVIVLGGTEAEQGGTMAPKVLGGKNAFTWSQPDGDVTYLYPRGDVMFGTTNVTEEEASAIFAALP